MKNTPFSILCLYLYIIKNQQATRTAVSNTSQLNRFKPSHTSHAASNEGEREGFIIPILFVFSGVMCVIVGIIYVYGIFSV